MGYLVEVGYIAAVCLVSHLLHRRAGVPAHITRKLIHILIGGVLFIQYFCFREDTLGLLLVPSCVTVGLFLVARFRLVPSMVNPENPYGIFYYALAILLSNGIAILYPPYHAAAGAAILCLALGDGAAALIASLLPIRHPLYREKSVEGTLSCFLFSYLGMLLLGAVFPALALPPWMLPVAALASAVIELLAGRLDNPAIVFGVGGLITLLSLAPAEMLTRIGVGALVGIAVVTLSVWRGMLTLPAALLALLLLEVILAFGGYGAAAFILALYAVAFLIHAVNKRLRNRHSDGARGIRQVAANGAVGGLSLLLLGIFGGRPLLLPYYAAIAEFLADTVASDIGTLSRREPIDLCRLRRIPRGRSGGISLLGTLSALAACIAAAALSLPLGLTLPEAGLVAAAALAGVFFDSVLGSLLQAKYRCPVCSSYTEKPHHCDVSAEHTGGIPWLDNSNVNLLSTLFSAVLAALLSALL